MNKKVCVFTGTRADYGLLYWLLKDIDTDPELTLQLLVSGMHLSFEFGETYRQIEQDGFKIDEKVEMLLSSNTAVGTAKSIGLGVLGFTDSLNRLKPDIIVVLGDRFEALAVTQTALILRIPVLHLHGGEITEGAYDDPIRHAITKLSYLHATSTEVYRQRVIQLGEMPDRVFNVGAIGLDHLRRTKLMTLQELSRSLSFPLGDKYFVVTYHPVTSGAEHPEASFKNILSALDEFPEYQVIVTYPNADDGGKVIIPLLEQYAVNNPLRVKAIRSLGQKRYLSAIKYSSAVIGNSSSGIIEVPAFDVPTVNVGMRQRGRLCSGSVLHAEPTNSDIVKCMLIGITGTYKELGKKLVNPYGQGDASRQVIMMIKSIKIESNKKFFDMDGGENDTDNC